MFVDPREVFAPQDVIDGNMVELPYEHGFSDGDTVIYNAGGGTPIDGLADGALYVETQDFVSSTDTGQVTDLSLLVSATDEAEIYNIGGSFTKGVSTGIGATIGFNYVTRDAQAYVGNNKLELGSGDFTPGAGVYEDLDKIDLGYAHGLSTGDAVTYTSGVTGEDINGLVSDEVYCVVADSTDPTRIKLAARTNLLPNSLKTFDPTSPGIVNAATNVFTIPGHGFSDGDQVVYDSGRDGPADGALLGLVDGADYGVKVLTSDTFKLTLVRDSMDAPTFDGSSSLVVDTSANTITFASPHGYDTGQPVL